MRFLLDTNVVLRLVQPIGAEQSVAKSAVLSLTKNGSVPCIVPQVVYEFWAVATHPTDVNGLGMTIPDANESIRQMIQDFLLLKDDRGIFDQWRSLVTEYRVQGKSAHDARLVAAMLWHGVGHLMTFEKSGFDRFAAIEVLAPSEVSRELRPS